MALQLLLPGGQMRRTLRGSHAAPPEANHDKSFTGPAICRTADAPFSGLRADCDPHSGARNLRQRNRLRCARRVGTAGHRRAPCR